MESNPGRKFDRRWIFPILVISMLVIDQLIKVWADRHLNPPHNSLAWPLPGVLEMTLTHNQGIAFGMAQGKGGWFTPIALLISLGAGWYSFRHPRESSWVHVAMALLAAGALGNLIDRVALGAVRDMFIFRFIQFPVFNWADACITVAAGILIVVWTKEAFDSKAKSRTPIATRPGDDPAG